MLVHCNDDPAWAFRFSSVALDSSAVTAYEPELDGQPDPGEVVWGWVPYEEDPSQGKDRPVLLIGHTELDGEELLGRADADQPGPRPGRRGRGAARPALDGHRRRRLGRRAPAQRGPAGPADRPARRRRSGGRAPRSAGRSSTASWRRPSATTRCADDLGRQARAAGCRGPWVGWPRCREEGGCVRAGLVVLARPRDGRRRGRVHRTTTTRTRPDPTAPARRQGQPELRGLGHRAGDRGLPGRRRHLQRRPPTRPRSRSRPTPPTTT